MQKIIITLIGLILATSSYAVSSPKPQGAKANEVPALAEGGPGKPLYPSFADIVEPLIPAVVNVYTVQYKKTMRGNQMAPLPEGFPFDQFSDLFEQFGLPFSFDETYSNPKAISLGSGFIIDPKGYIVTNHHVIINADEISVKLNDNTELSAKLIGSDPRTDLALLKVEPKTPLPFVKFGDSTKARVGDWVIAIGNPFGLGGTVTTGIISSKSRDINVDGGGIVDDFIQTDAAINRGNSGGPLFNIYGEVVGVNTAIFSPSGTNIGIGFSIPANTVQNIIAQLQKNGKVTRGQLGITLQEVTNEIAEGLGLKEAEGVLVVNVLPAGAGEKAGIKAGDIIVEYDGQPIKNLRKLQILVAETLVNKEVKIKVLREGREHILTSKITEADNSTQAAGSESGAKGMIEKNGITFSNLTSEIKQKLGIKENISGVVIAAIGKNQKSYGLKVGDLVMAINQQPVNNVEQLNKIYESVKGGQKKNIVLLIKRGDFNIFVAIPV